MEQLSLMLGIILMLVAAIGIVLYVALVIAIPVCRLIDGLAGEDPDQAKERPLRPVVPRRALWPTENLAWIGRLAQLTFRRCRPLRKREEEVDL